MKKNMFISVEPGDICGIGDTTFWPEENNGNTVICVPNSDVNMSYILLRNVLAAIGPEYKVWRIEDGNEDDVIFFTNLPRDKYEEAIKDSMFNGNNPNSIYANTFAEGSILCPDEEQEKEDEDDPNVVLLCPYINIVDYENMKNYSNGWHSMGGEPIEVEKLKVDYPISDAYGRVFPIEKKAYTVEELLKAISHVVCAEIVKGNNFAPHALEDYVIEDIRVSRGVAEVVFGS